MGHYVESAEGKMREIDVAAIEQHEGDPSLIFRALCECKYSADKPWVMLFSGLATDLGLDWVSLPKNARLQAISDEIVEYGDELKGSWHFDESHRLCHSIVQAFKPSGDNKGSDDAFGALQKIANAAWDSCDPATHPRMTADVLTIPCLVVEAPLLLAWYSAESGEFAVQRVPWGRLSWSGCRTGTMVDVVHVSAIGEYTRAVKVTFEKLFPLLNELRC